MRKVEHFICEICGTEYAERQKALVCERSHKTDLAIKSARYLSYGQAKTGLPCSIEVEYMDGKQKKTAVYKR